jgi:hypothetical protein
MSGLNAGERDGIGGGEGRMRWSVREREYGGKEG